MTKDGTAEFIAVDARAAAIFDLIYPVGSIFATTGNAPARGTWEEIAKGRTLQGADSSHAAGTTIKAGLPDITGWMRSRNMTGGIATMVVDGRLFMAVESQGNEYTYLQSGTTVGTAREVMFNASRANPIYGNSTTVQPPAYVVHFYRRTA